MSNTYYDDAMNIITEVANGDMDVYHAMQEIHQYIKPQPPEHGPQTVVIVGFAEGYFKNSKVDKKFMGNIILAMRPDGSVVVFSQDAGIQPRAYITKDADIELDLDDEDKIKVYAKTDKEWLSLFFSDVKYRSGF